MDPGTQIKVAARRHTDNLHAQRRTAEVVDAVLDLHRAEPGGVWGVAGDVAGDLVCAYCTDLAEDAVFYPCRTVERLARALRVWDD